MADLDIVTQILSEHDAFRRDFAALEALTDSAELARAWSDLADRLEVHASGEETVFYPAMLHRVDDSEDDTEHAVKDHNKIRDAAHAVAEHEVGSEQWWAAVRAAREENDDHLGEEEADVLPAFRREVGEDKRAELAREWMAFRDEHFGARGLSGRDKDPEQYVEEHAP